MLKICATKLLVCICLSEVGGNPERVENLSIWQSGETGHYIERNVMKQSALSFLWVAVNMSFSNQMGNMDSN